MSATGRCFRRRMLQLRRHRLRGCAWPSRRRKQKKILELSGASEDCSSVTLHWRKLPQAAADILAYSISVDGQEAAVVPAVSRDGSETRSWTVRGLRESRTYTFRLGVIDGQCRLYPASSDVPVTVQEDKERPVALYAYMRGEDLVEILFSKALDPASADTPAAYRIEGGTVLSAAVRPEAPERVLLRVSMAPGMRHTQRKASGNPRRDG